MAKKVTKTKTKQKQKQRQSQKVIVNISQPKTYSRRTVSKVEQQPKSFIPLMPSFNINPAQPQPISDLAKVLGMIIPKIQTETNLGSSIPISKPIASEKPKKNIGGLIDVKETPSLEEAIKSKVNTTPTEIMAPQTEIITPKKKRNKKKKLVYSPNPTEEETFAFSSPQVSPPLYSSQDLLPESKEIKKIKEYTKPRFNSMENLNDRFEQIKGYRYDGRKMPYKEFKEFIEQLEINR